MNERYIKWYTPWLSRDFEILVFGNGCGLPLIIFPTSGARYYENKDFGLVGSIAWYIDNGKVTVYCPDAIDLESLYNKSIHPADRMKTYNAYENVIVRDVFDLARRECHSYRVAVSGASLGAYHAANIAFRHPDLVSHLISLSGSFDISDFFDGYYDDNYYDNGFYDDGAAVAVVPGGVGGDASYCAQRYRSYDPASGTYLGYDGIRHPCP